MSDDDWTPGAGGISTSELSVVGELTVWLDGVLTSLRTDSGIQAAIARYEVTSGMLTIEIQASLHRKDTP